MTIAIEDNLAHIANHLQSIGYQVISANNLSICPDAVIYTDSDISNKIYFGQSLFNLADNHNAQFGILMINASNKTLSEIEYILKNKIYSPLF